MANKADLRTVRSKKAIRTAFLELMGECGYRNITIKDIAERAVINRKTFYSHYETKDELYNDIMQDILDKFIHSHFITSLHETEGGQQNDIIMTLLRDIKSVRRECLILMNDDTNGVFNSRLKELLRDALISKDDTLKHMQTDPDFFELIIDVYFSTFTRVLRWWLESEQEEPQSFIETVMMLFSSRPLEMLGLKEETISEFGSLH